MFYCPAFDVLSLLHKFPFMAYVCLKIRLAAGVNIYCFGKLNENVVLSQHTMVLFKIKINLE